MVKEHIGTNAGKIWRKLDASVKRAYSCNDLVAELKLSEKEVYMALGWLAREGKIVFDEKGDTVSLPVCPFF